MTSLTLNSVTNLAAAIDYVYQTLTEAQIYCGHGTDNHWDEAVYLTLGACELPLDTPQEEMGQTVSSAQLQQLQYWLQQRVVERVPLPYLLGYTWFAGIQLAVAQGVIIPRSPIAELIIQGFAPLLKQPPRKALDLCCGNGCIGIALALHMQIPQVDMVDLSPQALALCQRNVARYQLHQQVSVYASDMFTDLPPVTPTGNHQGGYDLIVSNPPYVDHHDFITKPMEYNHEPASALLAGDDGLDLVAVILAQAADWLTSDGLLVVEVGNSEMALQGQLPQVPFLWLDLAAGGHGVLALSAQACRQWQPVFKDWCRQRTSSS